MNTTQGYVQVAPDGTGKRVGSVAVTLPAGTAVTDADGNTSLLAADATAFVQRVVLTDSSGGDVDLADSTTHELLYRIWQLQGRIAEGIDNLVNMAGSHS